MRVPTPFIQLMCYANRLIDVTARAHVTYNARSISGPRGQEARGFKANCFMCSGEKSADSADSVVALVCRHTIFCIWQHRWHRPIFTVSLSFRLSESDRQRTDSAEKIPEVLADLRGRSERWEVAMLPMPDGVPERWLIDRAAMQW